MNATEETATTETTAAAPKPLAVRVVDFDVSFWHLVSLMIKVAFAIIPAAIIIVCITIFVIQVLGQIASR